MKGPKGKTAAEIHPAVVTAMEELGVDMNDEFPKPLTDEVVRAADVVITMGAGSIGQVPARLSGGGAE